MESPEVDAFTSNSADGTCTGGQVLELTASKGDSPEVDAFTSTVVG
jgi:hypothetical protein